MATFGEYFPSTFQNFILLTPASLRHSLIIFSYCAGAGHHFSETRGITRCNVPEGIITPN